MGSTYEIVWFTFSHLDEAELGSKCREVQYYAGKYFIVALWNFWKCKQKHPANPVTFYWR